MPVSISNSSKCGTCVIMECFFKALEFNIKILKVTNYFEVMKLQHILKGKILSQPIFVAQLPYFSESADENYNVANSLSRNPMMCPCDLFFSSR